MPPECRLAHLFDCHEDGGGRPALRARLSGCGGGLRQAGRAGHDPLLLRVDGLRAGRGRRGGVGGSGGLHGGGHAAAAGRAHHGHAFNDSL